MSPRGFCDVCGSPDCWRHPQPKEVYTVRELVNPEGEDELAKQLHKQRPRRRNDPNEPQEGDLEWPLPTERQPKEPAPPPDDPPQD